MTKFYNVQVYGYGGEVVVGEITKDQFEYWSKKEDDELSDHIFAWEEDDTPEEAKLGEWHEVDSIAHEWSCDPNAATIVINQVKDGEYNSEIMEEVFNGSLEDLLEENELDLEFSEEMYATEPGYYFKAYSAEKGCFWDARLSLPDDVEFNLKNFSFCVDEVEGEDMLSSIDYIVAGKHYELENDGGDSRGKAFYCSVWEIDDE